jgi:membrane dipeptidase
MIDKTISAMEQAVRNLHEKNVVIDALGGYGFAYMDILNAGINALNVTLNMFASEGLDYVFAQIKRYYGLIEMDPAHLMLVETIEDILQAKQHGKLGLIFGMQNGGPLAKDVTLLSILYKLGVRIIQLTYNEANPLGCGCLESRDTGLTSMGAQAVQAMNRLGVLIDLSHTGYQTSREVIEASDYPVAFTHANPSALKDVPRNRPDELIRFLADKGGFIGLSPYAAFCKSKPGKRPTLGDFLDQVDYVVQLVGADHVGIGTDKFEGKTREEYFLEVQSRYSKLIDVSFEHRHVEGFSHISYFPRITEGLLSRGYSDEECAGILGGNFFSLLKKVWRNPVF